MGFLHRTFRSRYVVPALLSGAILVGLGGLVVRSGQLRHPLSSPSISKINTASGDELGTLFDGLPVRLSTLNLKAIRTPDCRTEKIKAGLAKVVHFLGLDRTVYAYGQTVGCNTSDCLESQDPWPPDCGCSVRNFTDQNEYRTFLGVQVQFYCTECGYNVQGGVTCNCAPSGG